MFFSFRCAPQGSVASRKNQQITTESQSIANLSRSLLHREPSHILLEGKFE